MTGSQSNTQPVRTPEALSGVENRQPLCSGQTKKWFSPSREHQRECIEVCRRCHLRAECLDYAVRTDAALTTAGPGMSRQAGIWGGASKELLRALTLTTKRGSLPLRCDTCGSEIDYVHCAEVNEVRCICAG